MVVYHNDNSHLQEAPDNHCSTFYGLPAHAVSATTLRQFSCIVVALLVMTRTCNDVGHLPLGGQGGSYRTVQRFFSQALPWAMLFLDVFSSACLPF